MGGKAIFEEQHFSLSLAFGERFGPELGAGESGSEEGKKRSRGASEKGPENRVITSSTSPAPSPFQSSFFWPARTISRLWVEGGACRIFGNLLGGFSRSCGTSIQWNIDPLRASSALSERVLGKGPSENRGREAEGPSNARAGALLFRHHFSFDTTRSPPLQSASSPSASESPFGP